MSGARNILACLTKKRSHSPKLTTSHSTFIKCFVWYFIKRRYGVIVYLLFRLQSWLVGNIKPRCENTIQHASTDYVQVSRLSSKANWSYIDWKTCPLATVFGPGFCRFVRPPATSIDHHCAFFLFPLRQAGADRPQQTLKPSTSTIAQFTDGIPRACVCSSRDRRRSVGRQVSDSKRRPIYHFICRPSFAKMELLVFFMDWKM